MGTNDEGALRPKPVTVTPPAQFSAPAGMHPRQLSRVSWHYEDYKEHETYLDFQSDVDLPQWGSTLVRTL